MTIKLATGPVTWGVDFADTPTNPPWELVIDDIAASGLPAMELGPVGYLPEEPGVVQQLLAERNLQSAGSFIFDDFHDAQARERLLAIGERVSRLIAASGGTILSLIDKPDAVRVATAGRPDAAPRLDDEAWGAMLDQFNALAELARGHGVHPAVHPHVGGYVEFEDEIERLVAETDLDLCLDTGHLAYARMDPSVIIERHAGRLAHVHFKDIRPDVLEQVDDRHLTFWEAIEAGIFCPIGDGLVDIGDVLETLERVGYNGFATIEQDRVPGSGAPLDDVRKSIAVIEKARPSRA
jgi:inosose dehydratase